MSKLFFSARFLSMIRLGLLCLGGVFTSCTAGNGSEAFAKVDPSPADLAEGTEALPPRNPEAEASHPWFPANTGVALYSSWVRINLASYLYAPPEHHETPSGEWMAESLALVRTYLESNYPCAYNNVFLDGVHTDVDDEELCRSSDEKERAECAKRFGTADFLTCFEFASRTDADAAYQCAALADKLYNEAFRIKQHELLDMEQVVDTLIRECEDPGQVPSTGSDIVST